MSLPRSIAAAACLALIAVGQSGSAEAVVRNTYNGAECASVSPDKARFLIRTRGVRATANVEVVCPIVKAIFNSEKAVTVGIAASGGTMCRLESYAVLAEQNRITLFKPFPGVGFSTQQVKLDKSHRGAMQLRCVLQANDEILNYIAAEE
jgi:hypothetical protein